MGDEEQDKRDDPTDGPGNVSVDEPTEPALTGTDESGFGDGAPTPPDPQS